MITGLQFFGVERTFQFQLVPAESLSVQRAQENESVVIDLTQNITSKVQHLYYFALSSVKSIHNLH